MYRADGFGSLRYRRGLNILSPRARTSKSRCVRFEHTQRGHPVFRFQHVVSGEDEANRRNAGRNTSARTVDACDRLSG